MAPSVGRKGNQLAPVASRQSAAGPDGATRQVTNGPMPPQVVAALQQLAQSQARALKDSTWVGKKFADQSRAMHYGEQDQAAIHGEATAAEAQALIEEGVPVAPLAFPVAPPEELN